MTKLKIDCWPFELGKVPIPNVPMHGKPFR